MVFVVAARSLEARVWGRSGRERVEEMVRCISAVLGEEEEEDGGSGVAFSVPGVCAVMFEVMVPVVVGGAVGMPGGRSRDGGVCWRRLNWDENGRLGGSKTWIA